MHCVFNFRNQKPRLVDPFSYESKQFNTIVRPPKRLDPYEIRPTKTTLFRYYFQRGDIPIVGTKRSASKNEEAPGFKWLVEHPERLDYCYYLPILIEGLAESDKELRNLAMDAAVDLIIRGYDKLLPTVPVIIMPFKRALNTRDPEIIVNCLKVIQKLVLHGDCVGIALVPYYRQLLPICNLFKTVNVNLGSAIDAQRPNRVGDVIEDTLQILEKFGGPDAYLNIKYMIPTYESNVLNC